MSQLFGPAFLDRNRVSFVDSKNNSIEARIGDIPAYNDFNLITFPTAVKIGDRLFTLESNFDYRKSNEDGWMFCVYQRGAHHTLAEKTTKKGQNDEVLLITAIKDQLAKEGLLAGNIAVVEKEL